jgi:hypothetical protein
MAKFRKKPVVIEAEQYLPGKPVPAGVEPMWGGLFILTLEGNMQVSPGDWVITGVNGEKYPCKPDIFEKTYEPVPQDPVGT